MKRFTSLNCSPLLPPRSEEGKNRPLSDILEEMLKQEIVAYKDGKKNGVDRVKLDVNKDMLWNGMALLTLDNNRTLSYDERKKKVSLIYHPGCWIILDMRTIEQDGIIIAVERSAAFSRNTDKPALIICRALSALLWPFGIELECNIFLRHASTLTFINHRLNECQDNINRFWFSFPKLKSESDIPLDAPNYLKMTMQESRMSNINDVSLGSENGTINMQYFNPVVGYLQSVAAVHSAFNFGFKFDFYGQYEFRERMLEVIGLDDRALLNFKEGNISLWDHDTQGISLIISKLDEVKKNIRINSKILSPDNYVDTKPIGDAAKSDKE